MHIGYRIAGRGRLGEGKGEGGNREGTERGGEREAWMGVGKGRRGGGAMGRRDSTDGYDMIECLGR